MNQDLLRIEMIKLVDFGMKLNSIARKANINDNELSLFKNGFKYLKKDDAERLNTLLKQIQIPENIQDNNCVKQIIIMLFVLNIGTKGWQVVENVSEQTFCAKL